MEELINKICNKLSSDMEDGRGVCPDPKLFREQVEKTLLIGLGEANERIRVLQRELLNTIGAWEALPGGRQVPNKEVERWLGASMAPQINAIRAMMLKPQHPDDIAVDKFFLAMKTKLAKKRDDGYSGWWDKADCTTEFLGEKLHEHVEKGDPIDVANFCMFLHARGERIPVVEYVVGPNTMKYIFGTTGITDVSGKNMQAVWNKIEDALTTLRTSAFRDTTSTGRNK